MASSPEQAGASQPEERDYAVLVLKLSAAFVGVLFLVIGVTWVFLSAVVPAPEEVCEHKLELALKDSPDSGSQAVQSMLDNMKANCVLEKKRRIRLRGKFAFWKYGTCVLDAKSFGDAEQC